MLFIIQQFTRKLRFRQKSGFFLFKKLLFGLCSTTFAETLPTRWHMDGTLPSNNHYSSFVSFEIAKNKLHVYLCAKASKAVVSKLRAICGPPSNYYWPAKDQVQDSLKFKKLLELQGKS